MKSLARFALCTLLAVSFAPAAETPVETVIECSGPFETISTDTEIVSTFRDGVVVTGTNIKLYCDFLRVVATNRDAPDAKLGQYGYFKSLVAVGRVRIVQGDREALCGRAEIFPGEDKIVLTEQPVIRDGDATMTGERAILYRGQRRAVVEGGTRITLPPIKDLGFDHNEPAPGGQQPAQPTPPPQ